MSSFPTIYALSLYVIAAGVGVASFLGFLGRLWFGFELFSHFRVQYAVLAAICGLGLLLAGQLPGSFLSIGVGLFNLALILPLYRRSTPGPQFTSTYRILTANILGRNGDYNQI